MSASMRS